MTASEGPLDRLLDLVFYAPLGLILRAREEVPRLASQGRDRVSSQTPLAKMVGQMTVAQGRRQVEGLVDRLARSSSSSSEPVPPSPSPGGGRPMPVPVPDPGGDAAGGGANATLPVPAPESSPEPAGTVEVVPTPEASDLPIPGYDSLSASQVVQRLPGLSSGELEAVRAYEEAGRGRKTVLLRVAQLRAAS